MQHKSLIVNQAEVKKKKSWYADVIFWFVG
jgi:hypothetical protein